MYTANSFPSALTLPNTGPLMPGLQLPFLQSPIQSVGMAAPNLDSAQLPMMISQMISLLQSVLSLGAGQGLAPGAPAFGAPDGMAGSVSPANFLGGSGGAGGVRRPRRRRGGGGGGGGGAPSGGVASGGSSAGSSSVGPVDAKDAGGGWVNPVGGKYTITSGYGSRKPPTSASSSNHTGTDMAGSANTPILAAKGGVVKVSRDMTTSYGKWIEIQHDDGTKSRYAHMNQRLVNVGERVKAGQPIGKMGSTGNSTGNHLHFEVFDKSGKQVDPTKFMKL